MKYVSWGARYTWAIDGMLFLITNLENNQLLVWGSNESGQLGVGDTKPKVTPQFSINKVIAVAWGANHTLVLSKKGHVYATGNNMENQCGIGPIKYTTKFKRLDNLSEIIKIRAGGHSGAIDQFGKLFLWGNSFLGDFETPKEIDKILPHLKKDIGRIRSLDISNDFTMMLNKKGQLYSWGLNNSGQLGNGSKEDQYSPKLIEILNWQTQITKVSWGLDFTVALGWTYKNDHNRSQSLINIHNSEKENRPINIRIGSRDIGFGNNEQSFDKDSHYGNIKQNNERILAVHDYKNSISSNGLSISSPHFETRRSLTPGIQSTKYHIPDRITTPLASNIAGSILKQEKTSKAINRKSLNFDTRKRQMTPNENARVKNQEYINQTYGEQSTTETLSYPKARNNSYDVLKYRSQNKE